MITSKSAGSFLILSIFDMSIINIAPYNKASPFYHTQISTGEKISKNKHLQSINTMS